MKGSHQDIVISDRGGIVENTHAVHAAVVDSTGRLLFSLGNPSRLTLARSAVKPAQTLAVLETGAHETFDFDEADVALMCASHNGEDRHVDRARAILAKVQAKEEDLRCGGHASLSDQVNRQWANQGITPSAIHNNCSGKHAGMIGAARALGVDTSTYHQPDHPVQERLKKIVEELSGLSAADVRWAIDGCNLPAPATPLFGMARLFASFADAVDKVDNNEPVNSRQILQAKIFNAMTRYPEMVGGEGRFCTDLMRTYHGSLIGKVGADGFYGVGIRTSARPARIAGTGGIGIAVKIEDGSREILYAVVAEILRQLEIGEPAMREALSQFHLSDRRNTAGVLIGSLTYKFNLASQS
ncbi:putative thermolabile L-asparaginase [Stachybotrys elegans]|uniref:Thermolabile L-asparaginase n=1 Tax=Stachybotrys elegans TaxID=80388 RepID=A0A8K0WUJ4_9HYPO|nr:putative thermolabile L-asparaginase [Stachybotrys elegans]